MKERNIYFVSIEHVAIAVHVPGLIGTPSAESPSPGVMYQVQTALIVPVRTNPHNRTLNTLIVEHVTTYSSAEQTSLPIRMGVPGNFFLIVISQWQCPPRMHH
eukprot:767949-Hanusia_phi.AAC.5